MGKDSFYTSHENLYECTPNPKEIKYGDTVNTPVANESKLSMTMLFFAGGSK